MAQAERCKVEVEAGGVLLPALLHVPEGSTGMVVVAQPTELAGLERRDYALLARLGSSGLATLALGLMTAEEANEEEDALRLRFDISRLSGRVIKVMDWVRATLPTTATGVFAKGTAATATLVAATQRSQIAAIVSLDGRPDLAVYALPRLATPTLLLVHDGDEVGLHFNQIGADRMHGPHQLRLVPSENGTIEPLALDWLKQQLRPRHDETNFRAAISTTVGQIP